MATEFVGIELNLMGYQGVRRDLESLDQLLNSFRGRKQFNVSFDEARKQVVAYKGELEKLQRVQKDLADKGIASDGLNNKIEETKRKLRDAQQAVREFGLASRQAGKTFMQTFNSISSKVAHVGSAMQSMGNALTRLGSFMRPITTGLLMGAGYKALNLFTEGFGNAFERADTMRNYDRQLKALGLDVETTFKLMGDEALTAKENLDLAVQGLPTSLDEIMAAQKVYAGATGEMVSSTKTAIAANNAFLASSTDSRQQRVLQRYFVALSSGANLTAMQWAAMRRNMPLAFRKIGEAMGYTTKNELAEFEQELGKSDEKAQEFLKTFQELGTTGVIRDAAMVMTKSWSGLSANIRIAATRMGQGIIDTLNDTFEKATGRDLLSHLLGIDANGKRTNDGIRDWINDISKSAQKWIESNPDRIMEFFETLKSVDYKGLLKGIAEGLGDMVGWIEKLAKIAQGKDLEKWGRRLAKAGFWGRVLTIFGGLIKGMRHPLAAIGTIGTWVAKGRLKGFFGKMVELFGDKKEVEKAGEIGGAIGKAAPNLVSAFKNMALISGIVALPAFTAWGVTAGVKNSIKNFKETMDLLKGMDWGAAAKLAGGIVTFLGASAGLGAIAGKFGIGAGIDIIIGEVIVGLISSIATGFADLNMAFIKGSIEKFVESIKLLDEIPDVSSFGDVKTKISNAITMLNDISTLFQGKYTDKGVREGGVQGAGLFTGFSINSIAKALEGLKKAVKAVQNLANVSIPEGAVDNIKRAVDAVSEASSNMWRLWGFGYVNVKNNTENITESLANLKKIIKQINGLNGVKVKKGGITAVKDAIADIGNAFDATAIGDIRAKITAFVASIQDAFTMLDKLNTPIEITATVKLSHDFEASVNVVVKRIKAARRKINNAWSAIPTFFSKTITFSLKSQVITDDLRAGASEVERIARDALNRYNANGGMIYRAHGGSIFRPRGTDTVPAMLTPGEYVHNRRAVNMFGIDFMRKVNNLDMKGAMNELMHRAGHMANVNRGASITNNYNNNQKVVINNNNAGAGFTFKSASRFVGAF